MNKRKSPPKRKKTPHKKLNTKIIQILRNNKVAVAFAVICSILGGMFITNVGSFSLMDLDMHAKNSVAITTGQFFNVVDDHINDRPIIKIPANYMPVTCDEVSAAGGVNAVLTKDVQGIECVNVIDVKNSNEMVETGCRPQYPFTNWLPQAAGLKVGMILDLSPHQSFKLARIFNLLFYIAMFVFAIKLMPKKKWLLAVIGLLPSSVFLASSLSADTMSIALCAVFIAYIFKLFYEQKPLGTKQKVTLILLGLWLFMVKTAYVPLWLLIFALPKKVLPTKQKALIFGGVAVIGMALYSLWGYFFSAVATKVFWDPAYSYELNQSLILHNPIKTIVEIFYSTWKVLVDGVHYVMTSGDLNNIVNPVILIALVVIIFKTKWSKPKNLKDFWDLYRLQILSLSVGLLSIFATIFALYLTWTNLNQPGIIFVDGFQYRYLLPLAPLILAISLLSNRKNGGEND